MLLTGTPLLRSATQMSYVALPTMAKQLLRKQSSQESFGSLVISGNSSDVSSLKSNSVQPYVPRQSSKAVQVVSTDVKGKFVINLEALGSILLRDNVREKPLVIISVVGDFRKGKSFLLNYFLRYLEHQGSDGWTGEPSEPLVGFPWRGGSERETTGIWMWSEPSCIKLDNGTEVGVVLLDTQGVFDSDFQFGQNAVVFAITLMISSLTIYNILHNLQEDNLSVLEVFADYGKLALQRREDQPFQKLLFLIRDWSFAYEYEYGFKGGRLFLENRLLGKHGHPEQMKRVRRNIGSCFQELSCCLLPHPGVKVTDDPRYDGRTSQMDEKFLKQLKLFIELTLKPKNLVVKKIGTQVITGRQLMEYFKVYTKIFNEGKLPEPKTMLEATAEANNLAAIADAKGFYVQQMDDICGGNRPFVYPLTLEKKHVDIMAKTIERFKSTQKLGGEEFARQFEERLRTELTETRDLFLAQNRSKSFFRTLGTPLALVLFSVLCFALSKVLHVLTLTSLSCVFTTLSTALVLTFIFYVALARNEQFAGVVRTIDRVAEILADIILALVNKTLLTC